MTYETLDVAERGGALWITLNRPDALNTLSLRLVDELGQVFNALYEREAIRVAVLRGAGRAFCAGLDLKENAGRSAALTVSQEMALQRRFRDIVLAMRRCPQPIIGLIQGAACGGGFALALATDVRIGTPSLRMNVAPIRIGFTGCDMGISYFLPRMIGSSRAAEYMLTGRFIDAERARETGLVSRVVEPEHLEAEAQSLVDDMLKTSPLGLRMTKEVAGHVLDAGSLEAALALEDRGQVLCARDPDFAEAMGAFLEKRMPRYGVGR